MVHRGWMMHRHVHTVQHWLVVAIVSVVLLNSVDIWMVHGNLCMVDRGWMVHWHSNMMENWLFMVVVAMVLLHTMHIRVVWSNWMSMCCSMYGKMISRVMHIGVHICMMHWRNWVAMNSGMCRFRWDMHSVRMLWNGGVVSLFRDPL